MQFSKIPFRRNLTSRLILTFVAALVFLIVAVNIYIFVLDPNVLINKIMEKQVEYLSEHTAMDEQGRPVSVTKDIEEEWLYAALPEDLRYQIVDKNGTVVLASDDSRSAYTADGEVFDPRVEKFSFTDNDLRIYTVTRPLSFPSSDYYIQVATTHRFLEIFQLANIEPIFHAALAVSFISLLLVSFIVVITIRYMLKPLHDISQTALDISPRNLQGRLPIDKVPTEIEPLINAFNAALERLELGYKVQQELLATTAHELKTPLALIRGEIEMSEGLESREILLQDVDQIARQVHQLLHLAEVRESQNYQYQQVELFEVVDEAVNYLARLAKAHNVKVDLSFTPDTINLTADRSTLFILIKNLIENAITHAPAGTTVDVRIEGQVLYVRDYGKGIADEHFDLLFKKFWRAPGRRNEGAGLGLAICNEIAITHGWTLSAKNVKPGACFILDTKAFGSAEKIAIA